MYIGVELLYKHDGSRVSHKEIPSLESEWQQGEECQQNPTEQHGASDDRHVSESSQGSPFGPSHYETEREEGEWEDQKKKTRNQEGSEPKWTYALWVPYAVYLKETKTETETKTKRDKETKR